jgi:hypothetical protein
MRMTRQEILALVLGALATINQVRPIGEQFIPEAETPLLGQHAVLSSLELVTFILEVETRLVEQFAFQMTLADERAFSQARSPFRRPSALAEYIVTSAGAAASETA